MKGKFLLIGAPLALLAVGIALIFLGIFLSGENSSPEELKTPEEITVAEASIQSPYGEPEGSSIYGTVFKRGDNNPIANADIRAVNKGNGETATAQSAADGQYRVWVPSGEYMLSAEAEGYELSFVENIGVHSHALQNIDLVPKGQAATHSEPGNPENYVIRQGVQDAGIAEAVVTAYGYTVTGPAVYTFVSGNGEIAYRDGQAVPTYPGDVNGSAWAVPVAGGLTTVTTVYVMVECGNVTKLIVVETVVVMPPPSPPAPCCEPQPTDTPCPTTKPTKTPTSTPTATPEASSTATKTSTATPMPSSTLTSVPTATFTPVPPTATFTPTRTPTFTATATPTSTRVPPTLWGSIRVEPDSGFNQILDADVIAEVIGGTAAGPINYFFDCTSDGVWDKTVLSTNETTYRAVDLCDYPVPGEYTATMIIERDGVSGGANAHILVLPSQ